MLEISLLIFQIKVGNCFQLSFPHSQIISKSGSETNHTYSYISCVLQLATNFFSVEHQKVPIIAYDNNNTVT
jgi:hypothetical protein